MSRKKKVEMRNENSEYSENSDYTITTSNIQQWQQSICCHCYIEVCVRLSACVLLDATDAAYLVGDFGVVHKALELLTTYANGIDGNEVGGVRTGGPADACDLVQYLEGACNEIVEVGVEGLLLCAGLGNEGCVECIL